MAMRAAHDGFKCVGARGGGGCRQWVNGVWLDSLFIYFIIISTGKYI